MEQGHSNFSSTEHFTIKKLGLYFEYLAETVDDDQCGSEEVTTGGIFSHDVLVPHLDRHQGPKKLAQLLNQQVELTLDKQTTLDTTRAAEVT